MVSTLGLKVIQKEELQSSAGGFRGRHSSQLENNYFTKMCSGFEAGSYCRLIDFVYFSTLGLRVIKKKKKKGL